MRLHQVLRIPIITYLAYMEFQTILSLPTLSTFLVGGKGSTRRKPTTFGRAFWRLFTRRSVAKIEATISAVKLRLL
jgi:hypothetical protein